MNQRTPISLLPLALWPLLVFLISIPFLSKMDLALATFFYQVYPGFQVPKLLQLTYHYGPGIGLLIGLMAAALLVINIRPSWQKYRTSALMLFLVLLTGPGLTISTLNHYTYRPRPKQLELFGSGKPFTSISSIKLQSGNKPYHSFPSKRLSIAFFLLAFWRAALRENKRKLARAALVLALTCIVTFSWVSMARGGHFFSDILFSAVMTWLITLLVESYCYGRQRFISC